MKHVLASASLLSAGFMIEFLLEGLHIVFGSAALCFGFGLIPESQKGLFPSRYLTFFCLARPIRGFTRLLPKVVMLPTVDNSKRFGKGSEPSVERPGARLAAPQLSAI